MGRGPWLVALLLTPALAGCFGGDDDGAPETSQDDLAPAGLPAGITVADSELVTSNATAATYRWEGSVESGVFGAEARTSTKITLPAGAVVALTATLTWDTDDDLVLRINDGWTVNLCEDFGDGPSGFSVPVVAPETRKRTCEAVLYAPGTDTTAFILEVATDHNLATTPFVVEATFNAVTPAIMVGGPTPFEPCVHPWPCADGTEWPLDLEGPFELDRVEHVKLAMDDGVLLEGWVGIPALPKGVKAPTLLHYTPYMSIVANGAHGSPADPAYWEEDGQTGVPPGLSRSTDRPFAGVRVHHVISEGYAVVLFSVRGTAGSEGCFTFKGDQEIADAEVILDWITSQDWSNGRIGMGGGSYPGGTQLRAALTGHEALKTLVLTVPGVDISQEWSTLQGLQSGGQRLGLLAISPTLTTSPLRPIEDGGPPVTEPQSEVCPDVAQAFIEEDAYATTGERPAAFLLERARIGRFAEISASVLYNSGFHDDGDASYTNEVWPRLPPGSRMLQGPWGHAAPGTASTSYALDDCADTPDALWPRPSWTTDAMTWYDFWLKGLHATDGQADPSLRIGLSEFQDGCGQWHNSTAWPPAEGHEEVLYLGGERLAPKPEAGADPFLAHAGGSTAGEFEGLKAAWCDAGEGQVVTSLRYATQPAAEPTLLAGNPFAYLTVESDQAFGSFQTLLMVIPEGLDCADNTGGPAPYLLAYGGVDLRFHTGNLQAQAWPADTPQHVRVDMPGLARWVQEGDRIGLLIHYGEDDRRPQADASTITTHGGDGPEASHLVLPVLEGGFGGEAPTVEYPPRPILGAATP